MQKKNRAVGPSVIFRWIVAAGFLYTGVGPARASGEVNTLLSARLSEAPYGYRVGGVRSWPFLARALRAGETVALTLVDDTAAGNRVAAARLDVEGLVIAVSNEGLLQISDPGDSKIKELKLEISVSRSGQQLERRAIRVIRAAAEKPVTYYSDFGDDLLRIFGAGVRGPSTQGRRKDERGLARYDKAGFDQFFRRLQCQGVGRLVLWLYPYCLLDDGTVYRTEDYALYRQHVDAFLNDVPLATAMLDTSSQGKALRWGWQRDLMAFRLDLHAHAALAQSAQEHGIVLAASCQPFEQAVLKHYAIPVFKHDGEFLRWFQPMSSPTVNFRGDEVGFRHYRTLLANAGLSKAAELSELVLPNAGNVPEFLARFKSHGDNLRIIATHVPPLQSASIVLVQATDGSIALRPYEEIRIASERRKYVVPNPSARLDKNGNLIFGNLSVPVEYENIIIENPVGSHALILDGSTPAELVSTSGARLGRFASYFAEDEEAVETSPTPAVEESSRLAYRERPAGARETRVAGMMPGGGYHPLFFAVEASQKRVHQQGSCVALRDRRLVIHRGEQYSREMVDYAQAGARADAVATLKALFRFPAFKEIYVNTRSHTSLAASVADGADGLRPVVDYQIAGKPYTLLSVDLAYAPESVLQDERLRRAIQAEQMSGITEFQAGEWMGPCQAPDDPRVWRRARNQGVAQGVRALLESIEREFPQTRIRVVLPESAHVETELRTPAAEGFAMYQRSRNNYIRNIGEGLTLLNLAGLRVEPVLLGTGPFIDAPSLTRFLDAALADLRDNRGSAFRGRKGIMYEGQWTLKDDAGRKAREEIMTAMLAREEISDVIVYESADWAYRLPWDGFEFILNR